MKLTVLPLLALVLPLGGCGGPALPGCTPAHSTVALPAGFPRDFPLPSGSVVTGRRQTAPVTTVYTLSPATVSGAMTSLLQGLKRSGYHTLDWQVTPAVSATGTFQGHGYTGNWAMHSITGCGGVVRLQVAVQTFGAR